MAMPNGPPDPITKPDFFPPADAVTVPPTAEINAALAKAQATITSPPRNKEVKVKMKTGGSYTFRYATLDSIIDHVRKSLTDNGLWFVQLLERDDEKYRLVTKLVHSSGQSICSITPLLVEGQGNQQFGSALTYMRRYALCTLLGIAADEDDDANVADGNTATETTPMDPMIGAVRKEDVRGALSKTHLEKALRAFDTDLAKCADLESLAGLELDNKDMLFQVQRDAPAWWLGKAGSDSKGMSERIEWKRTELEEKERLRDSSPLAAG